MSDTRLAKGDLQKTCVINIIVDNQDSTVLLHVDLLINARRKMAFATWGEYPIAGRGV